MKNILSLLQQYRLYLYSTLSLIVIVAIIATAYNIAFISAILFMLVNSVISDVTLLEINETNIELANGLEIQGIRLSNVSASAQDRDSIVSKAISSISQELALSNTIRERASAKTAHQMAAQMTAASSTSTNSNSLPIGKEMEDYDEALHGPNPSATGTRQIAEVDALRKRGVDRKFKS